MADIQSSTIQSLSKVIESAQSGYGPNGLGTRSPASSSAQAIVLTVLATRDNQILLQDQASNKRIAIDKQALQGLAGTGLSKGDRLTLLSTNNELATFSVEKARVTASSIPSRTLGTNYSPSLSIKLAAQWPDINPSMLRKISPSILNQVNVDISAQNALGLAKSLIEIANKANEPLLAIKLTASVKQIAGNTIQLSIDTNNSKQNKGSVNLTLPLNTELSTKLTVGKLITIEFNANDLRNLIQSISLGNKEFISQRSLASINTALASGNEQIKLLLSQLLFSQKNTKSDDLVFVPSRENLQSLNPSIRQALTANLSASDLKDARLIAAQTATTVNTNVQLSVVTKPLLLNIDAAQLAQASAKVNLSVLADATNQQVRSNSSSSQVDLSQSGLAKTAANVEPVQASLKDPSQQIKADKSTIQLDSLRAKLADLLTQSKNGILPNAPIGNTKGASAITGAITGAINGAITGAGQSNSTASTEAQTLEARNRTNKAITNLHKTINDEMNQTLPKSESVSRVLPTLLGQLDNMQSRAGSELKPLIQAVIRQMSENQAVANNSTENSEAGSELIQQSIAGKIKETFIQPTLPNITAQNLTAQALQANSGLGPQGSLVNGLVTMLQASLQARLIAQQPSLLAAIAQFSPANQASSNKSARPNPALGKALQDLNRLDPRGNLISEINKVLSNHSLHKLSAAEATLQGQDSFYYALPNPFSDQHKDIEVLIKREKRFRNEDNKPETQQHWQLSMKLDIGDSGDVLAKVKLYQDQLDLNLYASNQALKEKILDFLPYLNRRLVAAGLQVKPQCFLGKIPKQLYKTDYQVVQAYV